MPGIEYYRGRREIGERLAIPGTHGVNPAARVVIIGIDGVPRNIYSARNAISCLVAFEATGQWRATVEAALGYLDRDEIEGIFSDATHILGHSPGYFCTGCDEAVFGVPVFVDARVMYCESCAGEHCDECSSCAGRYLGSELDENGDCPDCARASEEAGEDEEEEDEEEDEDCPELGGRLLSYGTRAEQRLTPILRRTITPISANELSRASGRRTFGIEIECQVRDSEKRRKMIRALHASGVAICKSDSSTGVGGLEVVTAPFDMLSLRNVACTISGILERFDAVAWDARECGMHVHCGKSRLTRAQMERARYILERATSASLFDRIAGPKRRTNHYCAPSASANLPQRGLREYKQRHSAVNMTNENTLEVRIFRSTRQAWRIMANVQFVDALLSYCEYGGKPADVGAFIRWIGSSRLAATWEAGKDRHGKTYADWLAGEGRHNGNPATRWPQLVNHLTTLEVEPETIGA